MKFFRRSDLVIILTMIVIGVAVWFGYKFAFSDTPAKAEIYYKSELIETVDLKAGVDKRFSIPQDENVVFHLQKDGSIGFEKSDCPDKVCIETGMLHTVGQTAACLPNEIILKIVPLDDRSDKDLDMVVGK